MQSLQNALMKTSSVIFFVGFLLGTYNAHRRQKGDQMAVNSN
jgi:hypothetical protein